MYDEKTNQLGFVLAAWVVGMDVREDVAQKILEKCPDTEWKLIFALSRFGGLRCPSETLSLRWNDIDFEKGRMRVHSPKTEHHEGKESRLVPLFPELATLLTQALQEAAEGTEYVIARYRGGNANLRTQLERIVRRAGLEPWPKLFHNLRATRQTELAEHYPIHVVCQWIGNSWAVAQEHYLQVTESHFAQAVAESSSAPAESAAQNPAQSAAVSAGMGEQPTGSENKDRSELPSDTSSCGCLEVSQVPPRGVEPLSSG
jgi:hypothetical protein